MSGPTFYQSGLSYRLISSEHASKSLWHTGYNHELHERMVFLSWGRPSPAQQKSCSDNSGCFNYDPKHKGATSKSFSSLQEDMELKEEGFFLNHSRVLVGSGMDTYEKGKTAIQNWRHFLMPWTFVNPKTPVKTGERFCVCTKEFFPWLMMPLEVVYVEETKRGKKKEAKTSFGFGSGTLQGHLLAGEERFSVEMDENGLVWYEILSFSKPASFLSVIGNPYVQLRQKQFAKESTEALLKHLSDER